MTASSDFAGRIVLITGGTSGIGLSLARALDASGAKVLICARNPAGIEAARSGLKQADGFVCDVADPAQVAAMLEAIRERYGRLDILVANVGGLSEFDFTAAPLEAAALTRELELNLVAPVLLVNQALPLLRLGSRPSLVMLGSGFGWSPSRRAPLYSAAKAGIRAFVVSLRLQLAPLGVHVMEVVPPTVDTPAVAHRSVPKISADTMAAAIVKGLRRRSREAFAGQTRAMPLMLRLAPRLLERITGKS